MHSYRTSAELKKDPGVPRSPGLKVRKEKRRRRSVRANLATDLLQRWGDNGSGYKRAGQVSRVRGGRFSRRVRREVGRGYKMSETFKRDDEQCDLGLRFREERDFGGTREGF